MKQISHLDVEVVKFKRNLKNQAHQFFDKIWRFGYISRAEAYQQAKDAGLIVSLIIDAGLTEFGGVPTNTCIAIGPSWEDDVNKITGHLKLL